MAAEVTPRFRPQSGPQEKFLASPADIAIYGGAAGGGKTWALLMEPLRHIGNPAFGAVFFRRTLVQVRNEGGLWDEAEKLYPLAGGKPRIAPDLNWTFPSGSTVSFGHLEHEKSVFNWQGSQIALLCVAEGTPVLMAGGSYRPIEALGVGDFVQTLEGARRVTRTFASRRTECVRATVREVDGRIVGDQVHPVDHPVLTPRGWVSYADALAASPASFAIGSRGRRTSSSPASPQCPSIAPAHDSQSLGRLPPGGPLPASPDRSGRSGCGASSADRGSDSEGSGGERRDDRPLRRLTVPVVLHGRPPQPEAFRAHPHEHEGSCGCGDREAPDWTDRYSVCSGLGGVPPQFRSGIDLGYPPSLDDADARSLGECTRDGPEHAPARSRNSRFGYDHPYTRERRWASEDVRLGSCELEPIGEATVYDVTIDDVNHYVTSSNLVNQNCFDELTHFSAKQFWYLLSRNRSMSGVRPYVRATCNPDADSWVAEFISWWIDPETGFAIPERSGVLRWFVRIGDTIIWADRPEELAHHVDPLSGEPIPPKSVTFVPAKLSDNALLMAADPGYVANLMAMPTVERERLLGGNWKIRPAAGLLFQRGWCEIVDAIPAGARWMRGWDLGATPKVEGNDPDWTAGTKIGRLPDGTFIVAHHCRDRLSPSGVERLIRNTAEADGKQVQISLPQDPGQAGKSQVMSLTKLLAGFTVRATPESGDKVTRFSPFSAQAEAGNVLVLKAPWNESWFASLEGFPDAAHDDDADSTSRAFNALLSASTFTLANI